jgi:hypothetical protein
VTERYRKEKFGYSMCDMCHNTTSRNGLYRILFVMTDSPVILCNNCLPGMKMPRIRESWWLRMLRWLASL